MSASLLVARHAPVLDRGVVYGHLDVPVQRTAEDAARIIAEALEEPVTALWASPAARCREPAAVLSKRLGLPLRIDERLREISFGDWEGTRWSDLETRHSEAFLRWMEEWQRQPPPNGELPSELERRVRSWLSDGDRSGALVVAHAGVVRALWVILEGLDWVAAMRRSVPHLHPVRLPLPAADRQC